MEIMVTKTAQNEIVSQLERNHLDALKLVYDNDGCGCAVNGVVQLWMVPDEAASEAWIKATGSTLKIMFAQKDQIYFEERLIIDYEASGRAFILKSNNQIYNNKLNLIIRETIQ